MVVYEFYYRDTLLGHLYIRDGQHRYVPIAEAVAQVKHTCPLDVVMIRGCEWRKPIPFFYERIENATRFGKEKLIRYHTDLFTMRMVEEPNE